MSLKSLRDWLGQGANGSGVGNEPQGKDSSAPLNHTVTHSQDRTALEEKKKPRLKIDVKLMEKLQAMLESNPRLEWVWFQTEKEGGRNPCDEPGAVFFLTSIYPSQVPKSNT